MLATRCDGGVAPPNSAAVDAYNAADISDAVLLANSRSKVTGRLTVIITTSPTPSSPSTELLETIIASFRQHCADLLTCRVILVLDTFDHVAEKNRLKKGRLTAEGAVIYPAYKEAAKQLVRQAFGDGIGDELILENGQAEYGSHMIEDNHTNLVISRTRDRRVTFIEPVDRLGFGLAVRSALRLTETPYVWVQQHDWELSQLIPISSVLDVMADAGDEDEAPIKYIALPNGRMLSYPESNSVVPYTSLRQISRSLTQEFIVDDGVRVPLTPLFFWHDKTHIASTAHYLQRIFPSRLAMARGAFIEDHVGQRARNQMKEGNWRKWACWLYFPDNGRTPCLRHLHGRTWYGTEATKDWIKDMKAQGEKSAAAKAGDRALRKKLKRASKDQASPAGIVGITSELGVTEDI